MTRNSLSDSYALRHWPQTLLYLSLLALGVGAPVALTSMIDTGAYLLALVGYLIVVAVWFSWPTPD